METYHALLIVEPKRLKLAEAEKSLQAAEQNLAIKQKALKAIISVLEELQNDYQKAMDEKAILERQVESCEK